jgi:hypothetical protein
MLSATMLISDNGFFVAISQSIGIMANVFPALIAPKYYYLGANFAEVPPCTPLINFFNKRIFFIAVVLINICP